MVIVTMNTEEVRNALERKKISGVPKLEDDDYIVIQEDICFSVSEKYIDRAVGALRQDGEKIIKDFTHSKISDIVELL